MGLPLITSQSNHMCKQVVSLQLRKNRRNAGLFVLEGLRSVKDALDAGRLPTYFLASEHLYLLQGGRELVTRLVSAGVDGYQVNQGLMKKLSETQTPQGLLAVYPQPSYDLTALLAKGKGFWLVLDQIQDPGNLGTLIRSAEAAGVSGVFLTHGSTDPYNAKALRAATGAVLHLPVVELSQEDSDCGFLLQAGVHLVGAALEAGRPYTEVAYQGPLALVIGNEGNGIRPDLLEQVKTRVTIPMRGQLQSLNAAIAGSILLFHLAQCLDQET